MTETTEYIRIVAGVYLHPEELQITKDGEMQWNEYFMERLRDYQGYFNIVLLEALTKEVGLDGWAVKFVQVSQETGSWFVDIYSDSRDLVGPISTIIKNLIPADFKLQFFEKGSLADYLK
ncbi:MAG TPA: hypothetical protein VNS58_18810 [Puia sp.]|nr:hypothetical protein [Puia sp.]